MDELTKDRVEQLIDYIMKKCLWQFHSRTWDRERQNENILGMTTQLLCDETVTAESIEDKCYWVDAVCLADAYKERYTWLADLEKPEIKSLMQDVKNRLDHLTITGSLNEELNDPLY
ncbi:MAG: Fe-only nitrogenase subunit delta [Acetobacterium woodii]|nr:Fe-only nitrogenase subunit delta [Acetobacterium woodii]